MFGRKKKVSWDPWQKAPGKDDISQRAGSYATKNYNVFVEQGKRKTKDGDFQIITKSDYSKKPSAPVEKSIKKQNGLMIKSQIKGWADWSTASLPPKVRESAEWLIENGYADQKDVKSAFYDRQTTSMSDDFNAEENDNKAIIRLAAVYKNKKLPI